MNKSKKYNVITTVRLTEDKQKILETIANKQETSVGAIIRQAVSLYIEGQQLLNPDYIIK